MYVYVYVHIYIYIRVYIYIYTYIYIRIHIIYTDTYWNWHFPVIASDYQRLPLSTKRPIREWRNARPSKFLPRKRASFWQAVDIYPRENTWKKRKNWPYPNFLPRKILAQTFLLVMFIASCCKIWPVVVSSQSQLWFRATRFQQADLTSHSDHHTMFEDYKNETSKQIIIDSTFPFLYLFLYPICWWFWTHLTLW